MKAVDGFEPTIKLLQSRALPLGYTAITDTILSKKKRFVKSLSSNVCVPFWEKLKSPREHKRKTEKV